MVQKRIWYALFFVIFFTQYTISQDVSLYKQFSGRYNFTFVGNTLNTGENNLQPTLETLSSSSAVLSLAPNETIVSAYLYWAGSGTGDFEIKLNNTAITAERTFSDFQFFSGLQYDFFGAFADITDFVKTTGNGTYTFSDLDIMEALEYSFPPRLNFSGWVIVIVYEGTNFPFNKINIYDGMQSIPNELQITLDNLDVVDSQNSKIGFVAWEGDTQNQVNESLMLNGVILSDPPLNPAHNAFNSTNSITGSNQLYNMDLDVYPVANIIQPGDTSAEIKLTSGRDVVLINTVITQFNMRVPDATVTADYLKNCNTESKIVTYQVFNENGTSELPANTSIGFYIDTALIGTAFTQNIIPIGGSETGTITLAIPLGTPQNFTITVHVDHTNSIVELFENNNSVELTISQYPKPDISNFADLTSCNLGLKIGAFDLSTIKEQLTDPDIKIAFFETQNDAENNTNPITEIENYRTQTPKQIWVRFTNNFGCFSITSLNLYVKNCNPKVYNAVSLNGDGQNDVFFIDGLRDIFMDFKLEIYNRWGRLLWTGDNDKPDWDGYVEKGVAGEKAPDGTYYYILYLNDTDYPDPISGYLYLTH